jgi:hypothetical protein
MNTGKILSILILLVGVALIVAPFGYKMFDRAPAGADMMKDFETVLTRPNVTTFQGHMQTFGGMKADIGNMMPAFAQGMGMSQDQLNMMMQQQFPGLSTGMTQMDRMGADFGMVIDVMDRNVENYQKANQLPMRNMPWFFVIAGVALIILAGAQLVLPDGKRAAA